MSNLTNCCQFCYAPIPDPNQMRWTAVKMTYFIQIDVNIVNTVAFPPFWLATYNSQ